MLKDLDLVVTLRNNEFAYMKWKLIADQNSFNTIMFILFIFILSISSVLGDVDGLYSTDDDVLSLNNETFHQVMESKPGVVWVVEFYNSWCGHCIHFAPTWKKLATEMKGRPHT